MSYFKSNIPAFVWRGWGKLLYISGHSSSLQRGSLYMVLRSLHSEVSALCISRDIVGFCTNTEFSVDVLFADAQSLWDLRLPRSWLWRPLYSGTWWCVVRYIFTNISQEPAAFFNIYQTTRHHIPEDSNLWSVLFFFSPYFLFSFFIHLNLLISFFQFPHFLLLLLYFPLLIIRSLLTPLRESASICCKNVFELPLH